MTISQRETQFCSKIINKKTEFLRILLYLNMYEDENKQNTHKQNQVLFLLSDLLRCWRVPYIWAVTIIFSLSVLYLIPVMDAVQKTAQISSVTTSILSYLTGELEKAQQSQIISGFVAGSSTIASAILIYIAVQFNKEKISQSKINKIIFRVVTSVLLALLFPLSFFLAGALVRQAAKQPLISAVCGINLCFLYFLGAYAQRIKSADLSSSYLFAKLRSTGDEWIFIVKLTLSTLCHLSFSDDKIYILILLGIALVIALVQLYEILFTVKYYHEEIQKVITIIKLYELIIVLENIFVLLTPDPLFVGNLEVIAASLLIFSYLSARAFTNHKTAHLLLNSSNDVKTERNAIIFVREIMRICGEESQEETIKPFLVYQHLRQCSNVQCFCRTARSESPHRLMKQRNFMTSYLFSVVDAVRGRFPRSLPLLALYLHAKMQYRPNFSGIRHLLDQFKEGNGEFQDSYVFYQFQNRIHRRLKQLNKNKESLPIEQVIKQNELEIVLRDCLKRIPYLLSKKYRLLTQDTIQIDQIIDLSSKVNSDIRIIQEIWREYSAKQTMSTNLDQLFLMYFQGLIPSPLQVKRLKATIAEKTHKFHTFNNYRKNSITMYSERACVLESIFGESVGVVSNGSKSVEAVLKIDRSQLLGKNIHDAMPPFLASSHKEAVQRWFSKESFQIGEGLGPGFFIDHNFTAFRCFTYIKLHSEGSVLKLYKLIVRGNDADVLLMSHDGRIEGLGSQLLETGLFTKEHLHTDIGLLTDRNVLLRPCDYEQEKEYIRFSYILEGLRDSGGIKEEVVFQCSLVRRQHKIGDLCLFALIFSDIRKIDEVKSQPLLQMYKMQNSKCFSASRNSEMMKNPSVDSHFETYRQKGQQRTQSSIQDSVRTTEQDKLIITLKKMACFPQKIILKWRNLVSAVLLLIIIGGLFCFILQAKIFQTSFNSFGGILKAGSDASNSNLILEVLYNNAMMLDSYCFKLQLTDHCNHLRHSNQAFLAEFYDLFVEDAKDYFSASSSLNGLKFSEHLDKMTNLTLNNKEVQISTFEFIQNFYSWTKIVEQQTQNQDSIAQSLDFLFENFQTMKNINHQAISFFNQTGQLELIAFFKYYLILLIIVVALMVLFIALMKIYLGNRWKKNLQLIGFYKLIGKKTAETLSNHFSSEDCIMKAHLPVEDQNIHQGFSDYQWTQAYHNYLIVSIVFVAIPIVFFMIFPITTLFPPSSAALKVSTALAESQSYLLESYFSLKTFYMDYNFSQTQAQFQSEILLRLNQTELQFAQIIRNNVQVFSDLDSTFGQQFSQILTQNVCLLSKDILNINEASLCNSSQNDDILHRGIIAALYFLQRTTMKALLDLRNSSNPTADYFTETIFQNLDDYMVFLLRMFGMVQQRITQVIIDQIPRRSQTLFLDHIAGIIVVFTIWVGWLLMGYREKKKVSDICGYILQLPESVLSKKHVIRQQKMILSVEGYA